MQFFCYREKGIQLLLSNIDLPMIHEVEDCLQVNELHPLEVEERVLVRVLLENGSEERRAGRQDELVCLDLSGATAESAVKEVFLLPDLPEGHTDVALKIIPTETKLLIGTHFKLNFSKLIFFQQKQDGGTN